jgi:hypothetical protein
MAPLGTAGASMEMREGGAAGWLAGTLGGNVGSGSWGTVEVVQEVASVQRCVFLSRRP